MDDLFTTKSFKKFSNYTTESASEYPQLTPLYDYVDRMGGMVAGGAIRALLLGTPINDVDMYFGSSEELDKGYASNYDGRRKGGQFGKKVYGGPNAIGFLRNSDNQRFEMITLNYGSPEEILETFDFTICKIALFKDGDEYKVTYHDQFLLHLKAKLLVLTDGMSGAVPTFERALKYSRYGFRLDVHSKKKLVNAIQDAPKAELLEFSGGDVGQYLRVADSSTSIGYAPATPLPSPMAGW